MNIITQKKFKVHDNEKDEPWQQYSNSSPCSATSLHIATFDFYFTPFCRNTGSNQRQMYKLVVECVREWRVVRADLTNQEWHTALLSNLIPPPSLQDAWILKLYIYFWKSCVLIFGSFGNKSGWEQNVNAHHHQQRHEMENKIMEKRVMYLI